jgi:hypothetical protein
MKISLIYFALSKLDSKEIYIGKTNRTLEERRIEHENSALNRDPSPFHKALIDNGFKNWKWRELEKCKKDDIIDREKYWIKKNIESGMKVLNVSHAAKVDNAKPVLKNKIGNIMGGKNVWQSEDAKRWMYLDGVVKPVRNITRNIDYPSLIKASENEIDSRPGITRSAETGVPTLNNNLYVFLDLDGQPIYTDGHLKNKTRTKRVKNRDTDRIYDSVKEAADKNGVSVSSISAVCNGDYFSSNGYSFCYVIDDNDVLKDKHKEYDKRKELKNRRQYAAYIIEDENYENPLLFNSTKDLAETLNVTQSHIHSVCKGERGHSKGWRIAYFDKITNQPELTDTHKKPLKKQIRRIKCLDDGLEYDNASIAGKHYEVISSQILQVCEGKLKTTGGKRFAFLDRNGNEILLDKHKESLRWKGTQVMCPELGEVFSSIKHFCEATGVPHSRATRHLNDSSVNMGGLTIHKI